MVFNQLLKLSLCFVKSLTQSFCVLLCCFKPIFKVSALLFRARSINIGPMRSRWELLRSWSRLIWLLFLKFPLKLLDLALIVLDLSWHSLFLLHELGFSFLKQFLAERVLGLMDTLWQAIIVWILTSKAGARILIFKNLLILEFKFVQLENKVLNLCLELLVFWG